MSPVTAAEVERRLGPVLGDPANRPPPRNGDRGAAAVLVPILDHATGATVLLTRRCEHLAAHSGQISFPGGRLEPGDADAVAGALRETEEEVGLARSEVRVLGTLVERATVTGFRVTPVVGLAAPFTPRLQAEEVADAFEVPLAFLLDPANHQLHRRTPDGRTRRDYYAIPWGERFIWGFTARILVELSRLWHRAASGGTGARERSA